MAPVRARIASSRVVFPLRYGPTSAMQRALRAGWPCAWPMISSLGGYNPRGKAPTRLPAQAFSEAMVTSETASGKRPDLAVGLSRPSLSKWVDGPYPTPARSHQDLIDNAVKGRFTWLF